MPFLQRQMFGQAIALRICDRESIDWSNEPSEIAGSAGGPVPQIEFALIVLNQKAVRSGASHGISTVVSQTSRSPGVR